MGPGDRTGLLLALLGVTVTTAVVGRAGWEQELVSRVITDRVNPSPGQVVADPGAEADASSEVDANPVGPVTDELECPVEPEPAAHEGEEPWVTVSGVVVDAEGLPVSGALVGGCRWLPWAEERRHANSLRVPRGSAWTGEDGSFSFRFQSPISSRSEGDVTLATAVLREPGEQDDEIWYPCRTFAWCPPPDANGGIGTVKARPEDRRVLEHGGSISGVRITLRRWAVMEVQVVADEGVPLPGIPMRFLVTDPEGESREVGPIESNHEGRLWIVDLAGERRLLNVRAAGFGTESDWVSLGDLQREGEVGVVRLRLPNLSAGVLRLRYLGERDQDPPTFVGRVVGVSDQPDAPRWMDARAPDGCQEELLSLPTGQYTLEVWRRQRDRRDGGYCWSDDSSVFTERIFVGAVCIEGGGESTVEVHLPARNEPPDPP